MDIGNLVRMANRIGEFFDAMPDRQQAQDEVAGHIQKFWEPRMRSALLAFLDAHPDGADGEVRMSALVLSSVAANRTRLAPGRAG